MTDEAEEYRPFHVKVLDAALTTARQEIDRAADDLVAYEKVNRDVIKGHEAIRDRLRNAESNRVSVEEGIRELGYDPKPRDQKGRA